MCFSHKLTSTCSCSSVNQSANTPARFPSLPKFFIALAVSARILLVSCSCLWIFKTFAFFALWVLFVWPDWPEIHQHILTLFLSDIWVFYLHLWAFTEKIPKRNPSQDVPLPLSKTTIQVKLLKRCHSENKSWNHLVYTNTKKSTEVCQVCHPAHKMHTQSHRIG